MEPCNRCGARDEHRMIGLMSHWFAIRAGLALEGGYFYLCPACYDELIEPHYPAIIEAIQLHHRPDRVAAHEPEAPDSAADRLAHEGAAPGSAADRLAHDAPAPDDAAGDAAAAAS